MITTSPLRPSDVLTLADIVNAAVHSRRVARAIDDRVFYGVARSVGDDQGRISRRMDIRDMFLRVTLDSGVEAFWPVRELAAEVESGEFVANYGGGA